MKNVNTSLEALIVSHPVPDIYLDKITLGGVRIIAVEQIANDEQGFAFVQQSTSVNRMFQLRAGDLSTTQKYSRHRPWEFLDLPEYLAGNLWCNNCGEWKKPDEFGKDDRNKNGKQSQCKTCNARRERLRYQKMKESRLIHAAKTITRSNLVYVS